MFKDPTMTTGYGSSLATVIRNIANNAVNDSTNLLLESFNDPKHENHKRAKKILQKIVDKEDKYKSIEQLVKDIQEKPLYTVGKVEDNLQRVFEVALGEAVSEAVEEAFGESIQITKKVNENARYIFRVYEQVIEQKIDKFIEDNKGDVSEMRILSPRELDNLINEVKMFLPIFDGPASSERLVDGIAIIKRKLSSDSEMQYGEYKTKKGQIVSGKPKIGWIVQSGPDKGKIVKMKSRTFAKKLAVGYSSAGVLPTLTEDGVDMSKLINKL